MCLFNSCCCCHIWKKCSPKHRKAAKQKEVERQKSTIQPISTEPSASNAKVVGKIKYFPSSVLGKGSDSRIFKGELDDGRTVAVKRINFDRSEKELAFKETQILIKCDKHENVVTYFAAELKDEEYLFIALELCDISLDNWIWKQEAKKLYQIEKTDILRQVSEGLEYLHESGIIHRDLKPANILMVKLQAAKIRVKISDFGISKELLDGETSKTDYSGSGTKEWMAPEILQLHMKPTSPSRSSPKMYPATDIFSLGCIYYCVLTNGNHPFGENQLEILNNIVGKYQQCLNLTKFEIQHVGSVRLIQHMIAELPSSRPPVSAILQHHLFWSKKKALEFLVSASNALEADAVRVNDAARQCLREANMNYSKRLYNPWTIYITPYVEATLNDRRVRKTPYDESNIMGLVRAIRNLHNHYFTLSYQARGELGSLPNNFMDYWIKRFPFLVDNVWTNLQKLKNKPESGLAGYYAKNYIFHAKSISQQEQRVFDNFIRML